MALIDSLKNTSLKNSTEPSKYALQQGSRLKKQSQGTALGNPNTAAYDTEESAMLKSAKSSMLGLSGDPSKYVDNLPK